MTESLTARDPTGRRGALLAAAAVVVVLLVVLGVALARGRLADQRGFVDGRAPEVRLATLQGGQFRLSEHRDGPVFVYFWASWCLPCRDEAPLIQRLWGEYEGRGYTFVGVNIWDAEEDARGFVQRYGLSFPAVVDRGGEVYLDFGVERLPTAVMLRPGLELDRRFVGQLREAELRELLDGARRQG